MHERKLTKWLKLALLVAFLAAAVYYFRFTERGREVTPEFVLDSIESHGPVAARLIYIAVYIVGTLVLLPGTVLSFAGAVPFGPYEGTLYTWVGATIGATLAYLMARVLGRDFVERLFGGRFAAFDQRIREHGFIGLLIIRLLPLFPFNAVNFGCGLTGIRLRDYVLATAIGIVPGTFVYQFLFAKFGRRILTEGLRLEYLADPELWLAIGLFAAFVLVGKWLPKKVFRKSTAVAKAPTEGRMNCREFTEFLHAYLFGDLPAEERAEFDKHLAECPSCVAYLDSYQKTIQLGQAAFSAPEDAPPPAGAPEELIQANLHARSRSS